MLANSKPYPYYIGARLNDNRVEIHGFAKHEELKPITEIKLPKPSIGLPLTELHDINELLAFMV